jgi:hypothetical protein
MKRVLIGVVVACVVLYAFGFVYWGLGPYRTLVWKQAKDDQATAQFLRQQFPDNGTYYVPPFNHDPETIDQMFRTGPVAFVHMLAVDGRPMVDPSIMVEGFFLNLLVIVLIAMLLRQVSAALPTYLDRVKFVVLAGVTAAVLVDGNDVFWWQISWKWKLYQGIYDVGFFTLAGLILAAFMEARVERKMQP